MSNDNRVQERTEASITEDEAALYDRQIRLWGMEAQKKMRNAAVLVVRVKGVATEALKNIALAGVGSLIVVDGDAVTEEDLGAGFFYRDEDVGKNRVEVAVPRIKALNPLVEVEGWPYSPSSDPAHFESIVKRVDMVCITDWNYDGLSKLNNLARQFSKPFYCGGSYGMLGYVFCDLGRHEYIQPNKAMNELNKMTAAYTSLDKALEYSWKSLTKRQTKELNPVVLFSILALWKYENSHRQMPSSAEDAQVLIANANELIQEAQINSQVLKAVSLDQMSGLALMARHEFSPVCAVVGGMLGQDMLKALSGREAPIANFFVFDGTTSLGTVCRMNM